MLSHFYVPATCIVRPVVLTLVTKFFDFYVQAIFKEYILIQGKKHQSNLARRAAKEAKEAPVQPAPLKAGVDIKKFVKIGRPGYRVTKQRDPDNGQQSLLFEIDYPEIAEGIMPRHRFMSAYEQKVEPPDRKWQYLLFAAEPYETIAFKVRINEIILNKQ